MRLSDYQRLKKLLNNELLTERHDYTFTGMFRTDEFDGCKTRSYKIDLMSKGTCIYGVGYLFDRILKAEPYISAYIVTDDHKAGIRIL